MFPFKNTSIITQCRDQSTPCARDLLSYLLQFMYFPQLLRSSCLSQSSRGRFFESRSRFFQLVSLSMDPLESKSSFTRVPRENGGKSQPRRRGEASRNQEEYFLEQRYDGAFPERLPDAEEYLSMHGDVSNNAPFDVTPFLGEDFFFQTSPPAGPSQQQEPSAIGTQSISEELLVAAIEEDKRRRNTAASARFRMKKREREAELERRTRDMTERCEDLQKRIGVLETENQWLRELITEKGKNVKKSRDGEDDNAEKEKGSRRKRSGS